MPDLIDHLTDRGPVFHRYVALGDSFSEGVGDPDPDRPNGVRGWADRVAEVLATRTDDFGYANLAVRGRKLPQIVAEQVGPALALRPDLVTVYAGGNDILRPKVDVDALVVQYAAAVRRLSDAGAHVVMFTGFDLGFAPVFRHLRGRVATYNELVREVADDNGATLVDFWRMREYRHAGLWDADRMHLSAAGHERMAHEVLAALAVGPAVAEPDLARTPRLDRRAQRAADLDWARSHLAPWVQRRLRGTSSGDGITPKHPTFTVPGTDVPTGR